MKIGAHVSTAGGLPTAIGRATKWGLEAAQIFVTSPQSWKPRDIPDSELADMADKRQIAGLPIYIHAIYLINLGSTNPFFQSSSIASLVHAIKIGTKIGATAVITHLGSHKGEGFSAVKPRIIDNLHTILKQADSRSCALLLENAAGSGNIIGDKFAELGQLIKTLDHPRLGLCFDTAHAYASGYDVVSQEGLDQTLEEIVTNCGQNRLLALHLNDTKVPLGGRKDRHEPIGDGLLGDQTFKRLLNHPALQNLPGLLETSDLDSKATETPASISKLFALRAG